MKRILLVALATATAWAASGQDRATEERLNKLTGQIEDLTAMLDSQRKQLAELARQVDALRDNSSKPQAYATEEDTKRLFDAIKEVDRKRIEDARKVQEALDGVRKAVLNMPKRPSTPVREPERPVSNQPEKGFEYTVQKGDTLSSIVQAYRDQNIKVTMDQVQKANPGLKPERMQPGQKIWIPAPQ